MNKLRVDDKVQILAGKEKGKIGEIAKLDFKNNRVLVKGINLIKKAVKPTQENPQGGFAELERPVHISNVGLISPEDNKPARVRIEVKDGKKQRVLTRCGTVL